MKMRENIEENNQDFKTVKVILHYILHVMRILLVILSNNDRN